MGALCPTRSARGDASNASRKISVRRIHLDGFAIRRRAHVSELTHGNGVFRAYRYRRLVCGAGASRCRRMASASAPESPSTGSRGPYLAQPKIEGVVASERRTRKSAQFSLESVGDPASAKISLKCLPAPPDRLRIRSRARRFRQRNTPSDTAGRTLPSRSRAIIRALKRRKTWASRSLGTTWLPTCISSKIGSKATAPSSNFAS